VFLPGSDKAGRAAKGMEDVKKRSAGRLFSLLLRGYKDFFSAGPRDVSLSFRSGKTIIFYPKIYIMVIDIALNQSYIPPR
jgi:hypothetical protein